jgi:hypothetical protein
MMKTGLSARPAVPFYLKMALRPAFIGIFRMSAYLNASKHRYVFVLAHMRSGSTLLSHILGSNPEFAYAAETNSIIRTSADLQNLLAETYAGLRKIRLNATYIVGQVNHALITEEVLKSSLVYKCVILIRSPEDTLKSRIETPMSDSQGIPGMSERDALDYYVNRLRELGEYGRILGGRAIIVEYEHLVNHSEQTLAALTDFFDVTQPFETKYKTNRLTRRFRNPASGEIQAGRIVRTKPRRVKITDEALVKAAVAFQDFRKHLSFYNVKFACEPR